MRYQYTATVVKVVDGDTVDLEVDLGLRVYHKGRFRLAHINAPEHNAEGGTAATEYLKTLLPVGAEVLVLTHKDQTEKYGRWLVSVSAGETNVNTAMIQAGHAQPYEGGKR